MVLYRQSAFKHGYTTEDIERVLDSPLALGEVLTNTGSPAMSAIGFASNLHLIDVRYQRHPVSGEPVVFHMQKVPPGPAEKISSRHS